MLFSIITVCYNAENSIEDTIKSLECQNFKDYEYVVIDGGSKDGTLSIIDKYRDKFEHVVVISESDNGIYDAMNKGICNSTGEYLFFLNAGDTFVDENVLCRVAELMTGNEDIYYGAVNRGGMPETYPEKISESWLVLREKMICHQAIFAKASLYRKNNYDTSLKICADREWLIKSLSEGATIKKMRDVTICNYDVNGVSSNFRNFDKDSMEIARRYGGKHAEKIIRIKRRIGKILGHKYDA